LVIQFGIRELRKYIQSEEESYAKSKERLHAKREELLTNENKNNHNIEYWINVTEIGCNNQRNLKILFLKEILQELETDDLKLSVSFHSPLATDLPHLVEESFNEEGIKLENKGVVLSASVESMQVEFAVFWVTSVIGTSSGAITIGNYIYKKLKNYKNTKIKVGGKEIDSSTSQEDIQKIIQEELKRIQDEIKNLKDDLELLD